MAKYLDLFTDYGFKKIFGEEANKNFLIDFFNALLPDAFPITDLAFKKTEQLGNRDDRRAVYDIYCVNERGERFIVEMQKIKRDFFKDRTLYYSTFPIREQAEKGEWDFNLKSVFCVSLMDFVFDDEYEKRHPDKVIVDIALRDRSGKEFYGKLQYIYLEMPNFRKTEQELVTRLDKWLYFIKNLENFENIPEIFKNEIVFIEAMKKAEIARFNQDELYQYEADLKVYRDFINGLNTARREGKKEGILEMVKKLREKGVSFEIISQTTGLTNPEIEQL